VASLVVAPLDWTCGSSSQTSNWRTTIWTDDDLTNVLDASGDGHVGLASATTRVAGPINHTAARLSNNHPADEQNDAAGLSHNHAAAELVTSAGPMRTAAPVTSAGLTQAPDS
jgi:hypothetical protein